MRNFTVLFLLAFAMTIGASQAYARSNNDTASTGRIDRPDRPDGGFEDTNKDDPGPSINRFPNIPCDIAPTAFECQKPKKKVVEKDPEDCSCVHKVMRVNGRSMPFIDCYKSIEVNGRNQMRYCTRDDES